MGITYTTSWAASRTDTVDSRRFSQIALVVADASETLTPVNVRTAVDAVTGDPMPQLNQPSPLDSRYFVKEVTFPRFLGPRAAEVGITYELGRSGGAQEEEDPFAVPLRYRVRNGVSGEQTDADVNGKPLLNSAGDPFAGTIGTNISALYVDVLRNEASYDLPRAIEFTNTINSGSFSLAGYVIKAGEAYCLGIEPEGDYKLSDTYVTVSYSFELRPLRLLASGRRETQFQHRLLDQGKRGWSYANKVDIYHKNGDGLNPSPASQDVLLNEGIPLDENEYVSIDVNFDPDNGRGWQKTNKAPNAVKDKDANTGATFLLYKKFEEANHARMGLS